MQKPEIEDFPFEEASLHLVEAAIRNQEQIETAIHNMQGTEEMLRERIRTLPNWVADEVDKRLEKAVHDTAEQISASLTHANDAAKQAQAQYEKAAKSANDAARQAQAQYEKAAELAIESTTKHVVRNALVCFFIGCMGMIAGVCVVAWLILPSPDVLQRERAAEQVVKELAPRGGNSILTTCNNRLCIRTDERGQQLFGDGGETYRIIYGY